MCGGHLVQSAVDLRWGAVPEGHGGPCPGELPHPHHRTRPEDSATTSSGPEPARHSRYEADATRITRTSHLVISDRAHPEKVPHSRPCARCGSHNNHERRVVPHVPGGRPPSHPSGVRSLWGVARAVDHRIDPCDRCADSRCPRSCSNGRRCSMVDSSERCNTEGCWRSWWGLYGVGWGGQGGSR